LAVIGNHGEPVSTFRKPASQGLSEHDSGDLDEFNDSRLGLQWQWQANPQPAWALPSAAYGFCGCMPSPPRWTSQPLGRTQPAAAEIPRAALHSDAENDTDSANSEDRAGLLVMEPTTPRSS